MHSVDLGVDGFASDNERPAHLDIGRGVRYGPRSGDERYAAGIRRGRPLAAAGMGRGRRRLGIRMRAAHRASSTAPLRCGQWTASGFAGYPDVRPLQPCLNVGRSSPACDSPRRLSHDRPHQRRRGFLRADLGPRDQRSLAKDVLDGLTRPFKELPPKHAFDARGGELFDPHHRAARVLPHARRARDPRSAARATRSRRSAPRKIVELGSRHGNQDATAAPKPSTTPARYGDTCLIDVDGEPRCSTPPSSSSTSCPGLRVHGIVGDFERDLGHVPRARRAPGRRVPRRHDRQLHAQPPPAFLRAPRTALRPSVDRLLLGTDLVKDLGTLEAAYNDPPG